MIKTLDLNSKLTLIFFSLGLFSYVNRNNYFYIKPSEFFFILATFIYALNKPFDKLLFLLRDQYFKIAILVFFSVLSCTLLNYFSQDLLFTNDGLRLIFKLGLNIAIFATFYLIYLDKPKDNFIVPILLFFIPYIFYIIFLFLPFFNFYTLIENWNITSGRFRGFAANPVAIAFPLVQALIISFYSIFYFKSYDFKVLGIFIFSCLLIILLWCASRTAVVIFILAMFLSILTLIQQKIREAKKILFIFFIGLITFSCLIIFLFNGLSALNIFAERLLGVPFNLSSDNSSLAQISENIYKLYFDRVYNVRIDSFIYYKNLIMHNFLGLGVNYYPKLAYFNKRVGEFMPPDSFLDSFVHGGFLLPLLMIYIFLLAYNRLCFLSKFCQKDNFLYILLALKMSLVVFFLTAFFGGFEIYSSRLWITLALCFSLSKKSFKTL